MGVKYCICGGETGKKSLKNVSIDGLEYLSLFSTGIQDPKTSNLTKTWSTTMIALCMHIYGGGGDDGIYYRYDDGHHQS